MFFIAPKNEPPKPNRGGFSDAYDPTEPSTKRKRLFPAPDEFGGYYPKRVPKACDRCRVKKVKCSGGIICARCEADAVVCVTSSVTAKDTAPVNPEQLRLVESQRDRLVQILSKILQRQDEAEAAKLREILSSMGLSMQTHPGGRDSHAAPDIDATSFDQVSQDVWLELYESLNAKEDENLLQPLSDDGPSMGTGGLHCETFSSNEAAAFQDQAIDDPTQFDDLVRWSPFDPPNQQDSTSYHNASSSGASGDQSLHQGHRVAPAR